jgi:hypothetical protein
VIAYQVPDADRDAHFVLPLDATGHAAEPFAYHGTKRSPVEILLDVTAEQRGRIVAARLTPAPGGAEVASSCVDKRSGSATTRATGWTWSTTFRPFPREGLVVVAIGPAGSPLPWEPRWTGDHAGRDVVFPDDCVILILPDEHPRAEKELARARTKAAVAAPFQIAGAVLFIPPVLALYGVAYVLYGGNLPRC